MDGGKELTGEPQVGMSVRRSVLCEQYSTDPGLGGPRHVTVWYVPSGFDTSVRLHLAP